MMNLFEYIYYLGLSAKKYFALKNQSKLPCKVISIGNITVGGTGKTPATIAVAEEAKKRGFSPVILTRGYKGTIKGTSFVSEGKGPLLSAEEAGDEPVLMAEKLKGVSIVKGTDRYEAGMFAMQKLSSPNSDVPNPLPLTHNPLLFILDDGFQHWKLHRDKDIVLIDANNPFGSKRLLPFGRMREPLTALERADIMVLSKQLISPESNNKINDGLVSEIRKYNPAAPIFLAEHKPVSFKLMSGQKRPLSWAADRKLFGFCAIASPASFWETIKSTGVQLSGFKSYKDHYKYKSSDIMEIKGRAAKSGAEWIVTTEKDMIKIKNLDLPENILIIEIEFSPEKGFLKTVFDFKT